jgi:trans-aconitate 2-methyltransferase
LLLQHLPRGRVVGLDLSVNMLKHAQQNLAADFGDRVQFVAADMVALPFSNCFHGIFSTASFHWVHDHDALFRNLYGALRPSGWLHVQCGGGPNLKRLRERVRTLSQTDDFSRWLGTFPEPWFFSDDQSAAVRLRAAGFEEVETGLEEAPFIASDHKEFGEHLRTFVLHRHLEFLPNEEYRVKFLKHLGEAAAHGDSPWTLDYWRLNIRARKPG